MRYVPRGSALPHATHPLQPSQPIRFPPLHGTSFDACCRPVPCSGRSLTCRVRIIRTLCDFRETTEEFRYVCGCVFTLRAVSDCGLKMHNNWLGNVTRLSIIGGFCFVCYVSDANLLSVSFCNTTIHTQFHSPISSIRYTLSPPSTHTHATVRILTLWMLPNSALSLLDKTLSLLITFFSDLKTAGYVRACFVCTRSVHFMVCRSSLQIRGSSMLTRRMRLYISFVFVFIVCVCVFRL